MEFLGYDVVWTGQDYTIELRKGTELIYIIAGHDEIQLESGQKIVLDIGANYLLE